MMEVTWRKTVGVNTETLKMAYLFRFASWVHLETIRIILRDASEAFQRVEAIFSESIPDN